MEQLVRIINISDTECPLKWSDNEVMVFTDDYGKFSRTTNAFNGEHDYTAQESFDSYIEHNGYDGLLDVMEKHYTRKGYFVKKFHGTGYSQGDAFNAIIVAENEEDLGLSKDFTAWVFGDVYAYQLEELLTYTTEDNAHTLQHWTPIDDDNPVYYTPSWDDSLIKAIEASYPGVPISDDIIYM